MSQSDHRSTIPDAEPQETVDGDARPTSRFSPALLTDLYELTMLQAYFEEGLHNVGVFSLFVRRLPETRNYLLACGLDDVLTFLETLRFDCAAIDYLESLGRFSSRFLRHLETFRFNGDVYAVPEGTPVFPNEPIIEVVADIGQAQFIETFVMNQIHLQTVLASKAVRVVAAAQGRPVVDFGLRRMHGIDAGLKAARAFHVAGVHATSNVAAGQAYGLQLSGTMAHSYIQAHDSEDTAFRSFARLYPSTVVLVDTYDSLAGVRRVARLAAELGSQFNVSAIRLDSGDLVQLSIESRRILNEAALGHVGIFASGNLDEYEIDRLLSARAPIDGFGVGAEMGVSRDAPTLDMAYKLVEYAGRGRIKLSPGKGFLPGRKQIFRVEHAGLVQHDVLTRNDELVEGRPLLIQVMAAGTRVTGTSATLDQSRAHAKVEIERLPLPLRSLQPAAPPYRVEISQSLTKAYDALRQLYEGQSGGFGIV
jgi:nicotinate phosphoribosyltransferase